MSAGAHAATGMGSASELIRMAIGTLRSPLAVGWT